jgi:hypothetical protein
MWKTTEGSTGRLLQLCAGYFVSYTLTGVAVKYFLGSPDKGFPGMNGVEYLVWNTLGSSAVVLFWVLLRRWYRIDSVRPMQWGPLRFPGEVLYIVPSGICTAVVIPTTTLMYTLPISVLVAMVIMRGSIIVVSRVVDEVQIRQGILRKRVYREENIAVVFALLAVGVTLLWTPAMLERTAGLLERLGLRAHALAPTGSAPGKGNFEFLSSPGARWILASYIVAYALRIYVMNFYKNTRPKGAPLNNAAYLGIEQISAGVTLVLVSVLLFHSPELFGWHVAQIEAFRHTLRQPHAQWAFAIVVGVPYGVLAFFSLFIFMFKGRTATFAGLVNRLTSLVAGTTSTLVFHYAFSGPLPSPEDWLSLVFILIAVGFLTVAERRRMADLIASQELQLKPT